MLANSLIDIVDASQASLKCILRVLGAWIPACFGIVSAVLALQRLILLWIEVQIPELVIWTALS